MAKTLVLTFIADDRPGLVDRLSETVAAAGGNWLESRMAHLAEKFAGIAMVEIPAGKVAALKKALAVLEDEGFHLTVEEAKAEAPKAGATKARAPETGALILSTSSVPTTRASCTRSPTAWPNAASASRTWKPTSATPR